jgi:hypothetical protein
MKQIKMQWQFIIALILLGLSNGHAQDTTGWRLEKMPVDLETDFALSALPPYIRDKATVYLLDPGKGYYISRSGTNGFICFIIRTEWERGEFKKDIATPVSYDAEGARVIFPMYADVAAMRASGDYSPQKIKDTISARFRNGYYKAPAKAGLSYMIAPVMRNYNGSSSNIITMSIPHYMFYAPYISAADIGGNSPSGGPMVIGTGKSPHEYIILPVGEKEKSVITDDNKDLLRRLVEYKAYFKLDMSSGKSMEHHH